MNKAPTYLDLTHPLENGMPTFPGDRPKPRIITRNEAQLTISEIHLGTHYGTHIDAPRHFLPNGKSIADFNVDRFASAALCLQCDSADATALNLDNEGIELIRNLKPQWLILRTGFDRFWGQPNYFKEYPYLSVNFARQIIDLKIKGVGGDFPSMDAADAAGQNFPVHHLLMEHEILIIENLTNLRKLPTQKIFNLIALPLKIATDGAPARVVAWL
ncbi:MAG TPA: cyclase family protein [Candidatus Marinimicrobia bacterium]|nr:cyclase family protein [Candidatus Neomarinimicrobiota bacterium]HRS50994.1 cyclase family protein [Candidatus Neomarinimicrobiota bacterium]HRU91664.1 cyclase family protein [Candidatus Neomarinimicrobiota bacterium]